MTDEAVTVETKLYLDHVKVVVDNATAEVLKRLGFRIQERAQLNIRSNDQIDTGFLINSIYTVWKDDGSDYEQARASAEAQTVSSKSGRPVDHEGDMAPKVDLQANAAAAVVIGANYAIYQEAANPFLYPAAEAAAIEFGGTATAIYKEVLPEEGPKE
jgi:hypothetical protein